MLGGARRDAEGEDTGSGMSGPARGWRSRWGREHFAGPHGRDSWDVFKGMFWKGNQQRGYARMLRVMTTLRPHLQMPFINHRSTRPLPQPRALPARHRGLRARGGPLGWSVGQWCWVRQLVLTHAARPRSRCREKIRGESQSVQLQPGKAPWRRPRPALRAADPRGTGGGDAAAGVGEVGVGDAGRGDWVGAGSPGCFQGPRPGCEPTRSPLPGAEREQ